MSSESPVKFEIGHVLFIDIVGYSKLVTPFVLNYKDDPRFAAFCQKLKVQFPPSVTRQ